MDTSNDQRNQMIKQAVMQRPKSVADVTVVLWDRLADELISIIGEGGFQSLYGRSVHLTSARYAWIVGNQLSAMDESRFEGLKMRLAEQNIPEACEASIALLIVFVDILAILIGEFLTTSILSSAWGGDALNNAAKELKK